MFSGLSEREVVGVKEELGLVMEAAEMTLGGAEGSDCGLKSGEVSES